MKEKTSSPVSNKYGLQEYLSLGYIYLIILGIVGDVVYFKFFGINILDYAGISDVLMAPIAILVRDIRVLIIVGITLGLAYLFYFELLPSFHHKYKMKEWYRKMVKDVEKADEKITKMKENNILLIISFFLFCMFLGLNIGEGIKIKKRIEQGEIKVSHTILMSDNSSKRVKIIGQNSSYLFFLPEKQKEISIMPISGNVKEIKIIKEAELGKK